MGRAQRVAVVAADAAKAGIKAEAAQDRGVILEIRRNFHSHQKPGDLVGAVELTPEQAAAIEDFDNFFVRFRPLPTEDKEVETGEGKKVSEVKESSEVETAAPTEVTP